ncbi:SIR2 family protein [Botrimarina mediterranea]|uniref:SIR2 family protein n=1 Tax=Botrimarina mediterranea TaxID=2528022 RepID=UPI001189D1F9|nr:hypothetical protein K2D_27040 [Planctomycetes bacterium K2D]
MTALDKNVFLREYTRALREGNAAVFAGAGVSRAAGYVDWKQLLREIAEDLDLDVDRESDLVALAQYHVNHRSGRDRINQLLIDEFLEDVELTTTHKLIASLPLNTVWTTNYDDLLELAFTTSDKRIDVKRRKADFATTLRRTDVTLYKMHGDKTDPAEAVLTKEDYETYNVTREIFTIALKADLSQRTFLFLGFSFSDPNVMYLLGRVKQLLESNSRKHYCILKAPTASDGAEGEYDFKRFKHWLADLRRYNIQPVLVDSYDEIPQLLQELNRRSHLQDVFLSGSAADFSPMGEDAFHHLCRALGKELINKGFNLITGFGLGVGDAVIYGAMQSLKKNDDERLQLWPFPQDVPEGEDRAAFWKQYRERMISSAGVCIVLSGNKEVDGSIQQAGGVLQEVEIARSQGKIVIPIGATGHVARQCYDEVEKDIPGFFNGAEVAAALKILGEESASVESLVKATIDVLKSIDK